MDCRSVTVRHIATGMLLALLAACAGKDHPPGPDVQVDDRMFRESYSVPALYLKWLDMFDGIWAAETLSIRLVAREPMQVQLALETQGLDARTVVRPLRTVKVSSKEPVDLVITLADLPMQSVSYSAMASVKATATRSDGSILTVYSAPVYHHFSRDYRKVYIYDFDTMHQKLSGGHLTADPFDLNGRILLDDAYIDINKARRKQYNNQPPQQMGPLH